MTEVLNEEHRHYLIHNAIKDIHNTDYSSVRLAVHILCGARERTVPVYRTFWQRIRDTLKVGYLEWKREVTIVPIQAP